MTTNQEGRQAAIRDSTSTAYGVAADWNALFDDAGISAGTFNERLLAWINAELSASHSNLVSAMQAYAEDAGYDGWEDMATLVLSMNGAETLLDGETQGLAFDFTDQSALIIDTGTPANNYDSTGIVLSGSLVGPSGKLTYTSPSNKLTRQSDGYYKYQAHNLASYSNNFEGNSVNSSNNATVSGNVVSISGANAYLYRTLSTAMVSGASYQIDCDVTCSTTAVVGLRVATGTERAELAVACTAGVTQSVTLTFTMDAMAIQLGVEQRPAITAGVSDLTGETVTIENIHLRRTPSNDDYIETAGAAKYALPIEYDTSGNCLGLLVEEARTNLHTYSNTFSNAAWQKVGSVAQNATGVDGLTSAWTLTDSATTASFRFSQAPTLTAAVYSNSIYAKAGTNSWLRILLDSTASGSVSAFYDLSTGEVGTISGSGITASITSVGNGWYRCTAVATMTAAACRVYFQMCTADNQSSYTGDGTGTMLFQHAQTELGSFPTSPIITYGATATRAADNISIATSLTPYSATENTILMSFTDDKNLGSNNPWLEISPASRANGLTQIYTSSGSITARYYGPSFASQCLFTDAYVSETATTKVGISLKANLFDCSINGSTEAQDTAGTYQTNADTNIALGNQSGGAVQCNGIIRYLCIKPRTSSATEIRTETT